MRLDDPEIGQQQCDGFAAHRAAPVGMQSELAGLNAVLCARLGDEPLGERGALVGRNHPADDVPTEDVEDDVQMKVRPLDRAEQLGDVPAPDFVGPRRQQFRRGVVRAPDLIAPSLTSPAASNSRYIVRGEQR